jgi:hypothetical protein
MNIEAKASLRSGASWLLSCTTMGLSLAACIGSESADLRSKSDPEVAVATAALTCNGNPVPLTDPCKRDLWPGGVIPYKIDIATIPVGRRQRTDIYAAIAAWESVTGSRIHFVETNTDPERVIIKNDGSGNCAAGIPGKDVATGTQSLILNLGCNYAHELGHVIGLSHEHQRDDRDRYIDFGFTQTCSTWNDNGLKCEWGSPGSDFNSYRTDSTMQYGSTSTFPIFEKGTMTPVPGSTVPTLTDGSNARMMYAYEWGWTKFLPLGFDVDPNAPLDYHIAPSVSPVGRPAVSSQGVGALDYFVRGSDSHIYHRYYTEASGWSGYFDLGSSFSSAPAATTFGSGSAIVSAHFGGTVYVREFTGGAWQNWVSLGSPSGTTACAEPALAASGSTLRAFIRACNGSIYQRTRTSGTWSSWSSLAGPPSGVTFTGAPAAVALSSSNVELIANGTDGNIYHTTRNSAGVWSTWASRGGIVQQGSSPAISGRGSRIDIVFWGSDGDLWWMYRDGTTWSPTRVLGGRLSDSPTAFSGFSDHIDVLAPLQGGGISLRWFD